jgi:hypothetical protein
MTPEAALVLHVMVAFPEVVLELSVIVFGAVKLWSGAPKLLQAGESTAPEGAPVTAALSVTVPANPFAPDTVIRQVPDEPGAAIVIVAAVHPEEDTLIPGVPTLIVTPLAVVDVE